MTISNQSECLYFKLFKIGVIFVQISSGFYIESTLWKSKNLQKRTSGSLKNFIRVGAAAIAPCFSLHLQQCGPGFESQAHHLRFYNLYYWNCNEKRTKINKKKPELSHFLKNNGTTAVRRKWLSCKPTSSKRIELPQFNFKLITVVKVQQITHVYECLGVLRM